MPQRFRIVPRRVAHKCKVQIFFEIAVLNSVFRARRLVLVIVIFQRLRESHRRQPRLVKRIVIAAAAVAVHAENHSNCPAPIDFFNRARQFSRRRIRILDLSISRKKPHAMRRAGRRVRAHDVVVQHSAHRVTLLLHPIHQVRAAEQPLLFSGHRGEKYRRAIRRSALRPCLAQQTRALDAHRHTR